MGAFNYSVGELTSQIKKMGRMNLAHLGNDNDQNTYIWYYMTLAMWKFVSLAFVVRTSDPLTVSSDGYVTFKHSDSDIEDLYEQLRILTPTEEGRTVKRRTSFDGSDGWYRESANSRIHIKGSGTYVMQYKAYPAKASTATQILEWPATSYDLLQYETIGKIKESLNDLEGAAQAYSIADKLIQILIKANADAIGTTGGRPPNQNEAQFYRR